ncbi:hypothetical protein AALB39_15035 [Lachnospiraceae bacterium 54-53]
MHRVYRKLHNSRGASMLIALLFFLICVTTGTMILTAASASSVKSKDRYSNEQHYLAVASAARLLKAEMGSCTYTVGKTWQTWDTGETNPDTGQPVTESGWKEIEPFITPEDGEGDILTTVYEEINEGTRDPENSENFSVKAENDIPPVHMKMKMERNGDALFVLNSGSYSMNVSFTARTSRVTDYLSYDYKITSWSEGIITKEAES